MPKSSSKLDLTTIVSPSPTPDASQAIITEVVKKPQTLELFGPILPIMQQMAILIRQGYTPSMNIMMDVYSAPGFIRINLERGDPDASFAQAAAVSIADAVALEQIEFNRAVAVEAARQIKVEADGKIAARKAALIAEQQQALAAIEAEIAALSK